eukprot:scaffold47551_cov95-Cyclotella_meneghiniana.AAC.1
MKHLPIPVPSDVRPSNAHQFLTHIVLSLGKYDTEIDALTHQTTRQCLQSVGLIGPNADVSSLKRYTNTLTRSYIEEQLVFYPISLDVAQIYLVTAHKVFADAIMRNELSMNELPPFTMSTLLDTKTEETNQWWQNIKNSQLDAVYSVLQHTQGIPTRETVSAVTRDTPLEWSPTEDIHQYDRQSDESFEEQKLAIGIEARQLDKYRNAADDGNLTYIKNTVIHGAPGTGKSFVSELLVLYAISLGLNILSSALMAIRANALGCPHLHEFFKLPTSDTTVFSAFQGAQAALEKIMRDPMLLHALRTLDVLFLDECSQVSAEYLSMIDIILRKVRNSQTPFGGVHVFGTMDPAQLQAIKMRPFLISAFMLSCFQMVELKHSVRAHGDPEFRRLQQLSRMDADVLLSSQALKEEFFQKAG